MPPDRKNKKTSLLCETELGHLTHLINGLLVQLVRCTPSQLGTCDLLGAVTRMPNLDFLGDAAALLGSEVTTGLRLELEFVALIKVSGRYRCSWNGSTCLCNSELEVKLANGLGYVVGKREDDIDGVLINRSSSRNHLDLDVRAAYGSLVLLRLARLWRQC